MFIIRNDIPHFRQPEYEYFFYIFQCYMAFRDFHNMVISVKKQTNQMRKPRKMY